jgi:hypothetical protein
MAVDLVLDKNKDWESQLADDVIDGVDYIFSGIEGGGNSGNTGLHLSSIGPFCSICIVKRT